MNKVILGQEVYDQIMYYVNKTNFEISGLGAVEIIEGVPTVTKIYLLDQENAATETEMDGAAIAKLMYEHEISGHPGDLKFWWHSHVNMGVFWSGTDMTTIEELTQHGWFIHGVFNKKYEYKVAYTTFDPVWIMVDDITMEIDAELVSPELLALYEKQGELLDRVEKDCDKLYKKHVTEKTYAVTKTYNFPQYEGATYYHGDYLSKADNIIDLEVETVEDIKAKNDVFLEEAGYWELLDNGYTDDQIMEFNNKGIFNLADLNKHNFEDPDFMMGWTDKA